NILPFFARQLFLYQAVFIVVTVLVTQFVQHTPGNNITVCQWWKYIGQIPVIIIYIVGIVCNSVVVSTFEHDISFEVFKLFGGIVPAISRFPVFVFDYGFV